MKSLKKNLLTLAVLALLAPAPHSSRAHAGWSAEFKGGFPHARNSYRQGHGPSGFARERQRVWVSGHWIRHGCHRHWIPGHFETVNCPIED